VSLADHDIALIRTAEPGVWNIKIDNVQFTEEVTEQDDIITEVARLVYRIESVARIRADIDRGIF
jgi:hypothetical protein